MRFAILGTGSAGNSVVVEHEGQYLLIDAGFSARELTRRLSLLAVLPEQIQSILLTHEHSDHTKGLANFCKQNPAIQVVTNALTRRSIEHKMPHVRWLDIERGALVSHGNFAIESFALIHDAVAPMGFLLRPHQAQQAQSQAIPGLGILLDCGKPPQNALNKLRLATSLILEANYDEELLAADTKRPASIKARIAGRHGHLSNQQASEVVLELQSQNLRAVILGHLSQDCNTPEKALQQIRKALARSKAEPLRLYCAKQHEPSPWIEA